MLRSFQGLPRLVRLPRSFCQKKSTKTSYKPLILYSLSIGIAGGLLGSYYTKRSISKHEETHSPPTTDQPAILATQATESELPSPSTESKAEINDSKQKLDIFYQIFLSGGLPFEAEELHKNIGMPTDEDAILLLVPPRENKELLENMAEMLINLYLLHSIGVQRGSFPSPLKVMYTRIESVKDLKEVGEVCGVNLEASEDVPLILVNNRIRKKRQIVTLLELLEREEDLYKVFRPLKQAGSESIDTFKSLLSGLLEDEVVLMQYSPTSSPFHNSIRSELYERYMEGLGDLKRVEVVFVDDLGWVSNPTDLLDRTVNDGEMLLLQKVSNKTLDSTQRRKLPGIEGEWVVTSIVTETPNKALELSDLAELVGDTLYRQTIAGHNELVPLKSRWVLEFRYDNNKMSDAQVGAVYAAFKRARETLDKIPEGNKLLNIRLIPKSFELSEGRLVSLIIRDRKKQEDRFKFLFENKDRVLIKKMLADSPYLELQDSFEFSYPDELGFSTEGILTFIDKALAGKLVDEPSSEIVPKYERFSRKLSGHIFTEKVKENNISQGVFLYSETCGSCKKFTPLYEKLARENIEAGMTLFGRPTQLNRMDKDRNDVPNDKNYDSTPVFMIYRADWKKQPYIYRQSYLTDVSLREFLSLSQEFGLLDEEGIQSLVGQQRAVELMHN